MSYGALKSWADVQNLLTQNAGSISSSPHGAFWQSLSYDDFVNGCVPDPNGLSGGPPCVLNPNQTPPPAGTPVQILIKGNSKESNIILALRGMTPFDQADNPDDPFPQMPAGGSTPWTNDQIDQLAAWIDAGCPE